MLVNNVLRWTGPAGSCSSGCQPVRPLVVDAVDVVDVVQHRVEFGGEVVGEEAARRQRPVRGERPDRWRRRTGHGARHGQGQGLVVVPATRHEREVAVRGDQLLQPRQDLVVGGGQVHAEELAHGRAEAQQLRLLARRLRQRRLARGEVLPQQVRGVLAQGPLLVGRLRRRSHL
ncbi:hypothetical protein FOCC_FOCC003014, partial [Frankliniella occidentalis]